MPDVNYLEINQLQPNPFQPRDQILKEDLGELIESVKSYGIIQPLTVAQTPAGYQIIAGERRWRAAKEAGLDKVPVKVRKTTPKEMLELALVENVQRKDLNPIERAKGFKRLINEFDFDLMDLAVKIGKSESYISNSQRLLHLPDAIKDGLIQGKITEGHARALAGLEDELTAINCYRQILEEGGSVRRAEQLVREIKKGSKTASPKQRVKKSAQKDERLKVLEQSFKHNFEAPANVDLSRSNIQTRITITLMGNTDRTEADLEKFIRLLKE